MAISRKGARTRPGLHNPLLVLNPDVYSLADLHSTVAANLIFILATRSRTPRRRSSARVALPCFRRSCLQRGFLHERTTRRTDDWNARRTPRSRAHYALEHYLT